MGSIMWMNELNLKFFSKSSGQHCVEFVFIGHWTLEYENLVKRFFFIFLFYNTICSGSLTYSYISEKPIWCEE